MRLRSRWKATPSRCRSWPLRAVHEGACLAHRLQPLHQCEQCRHQLCVCVYAWSEEDSTARKPAGAQGRYSQNIYYGLSVLCATVPVEPLKHTPSLWHVTGPGCVAGSSWMCPSTSMRLRCLHVLVFTESLLKIGEKNIHIKKGVSGPIKLLKSETVNKV